MPRDTLMDTGSGASMKSILLPVSEFVERLSMCRVQPACVWSRRSTKSLTYCGSSLRSTQTADVDIPPPLRGLSFRSR